MRRACNTEQTEMKGFLLREAEQEIPFTGNLFPAVKTHSWVLKEESV